MIPTVADKAVVVSVQEAPRREAPLGLLSQAPTATAAVEQPVLTAAKPKVEEKTARKEIPKYRDMSMPDFMKMLDSLAREHDYIAGRVEIGGCVETIESNGARGYVVDVKEDGRFKVLMPLVAGGFEQRDTPARLLRRLPQCKKLVESARAGEVLKEWQKLEPWDN